MKRIMFSFILGILFCTCFYVIAANTISSESVSYENSKTLETTVNGALDELFSAVDINEKMAAMEQRIIELENNSLTVNETYPVGSIFISTANTNPSTIFSGTTWERYGVGKTLVSTDGTSGQTGGSNTVTLTTNNLPSHAHSIPTLSGTAASTGSGYSIGYTYATRTSVSTGSGYSITYGSSARATSSTGAHNHSLTMYVSGAEVANYGLAVGGGFANRVYVAANYNSLTTSSVGDHAHTVSDYYATAISGVAAHTHNYNDYYANSISGIAAHTHSVSTTASTTGAIGSGTAVNIQNPYITVYMWKRTA